MNVVNRGVSDNIQCMDTGRRMAATKPVHYVIYQRIRLRPQGDPPQGRSNCLRRIITAVTAANTHKYNMLQTRGGRNKINRLINGFKLFQYQR